MKTFTGDDGIARVAEVKTAAGSVKGAIHRLAPLFTEEHTEPPADAKSPTNTEEPPTPTKRRKIYPNIYMANIITVILCLPLALCNSVKVTNFSNEPGIHIESMGKVYPTLSYWNLLIYYDLQPLKTELAMLNKGIKILRTTCSQLHHEICDDFLPQFTQAANELRIDSTLLAPIRAKRGALNIVGNIAHSLFGVLDSEYAETMVQTIKEIESIEHYILDLLKNQTSIIDSTINVMKTDEEEAKIKFDSIDKSVAELRKVILSNNESINQQAMQISLIFLTVHLIVTTTNIQRTQAMILSVLTDVHHGQVGPLLLSPQQLKNELIKIKAHLPPSTQLPVQEDDLLGIYKLMAV